MQLKPAARENASDVPFNDIFHSLLVTDARQRRKLPSRQGSSYSSNLRAHMLMMMTHPVELQEIGSVLYMQSLQSQSLAFWLHYKTIPCHKIQPFSDNKFSTNLVLLTLILGFTGSCFCFSAHVCFE